MVSPERLTSLNIHMCVFFVSLLSGVAKFSLKVTVVCSYAYFSLDSKLCVVECACTLCRVVVYVVFPCWVNASCCGWFLVSGLWQAKQLVY